MTAACVKLLPRKAGSEDVSVTKKISLPSKILSSVIPTWWHRSSPDTDPPLNVRGTNRNALKSSTSVKKISIR